MSRSLGLDVTTMRYISVKSTGHFRDGFEPIAGSLESIFIVDHGATRLPTAVTVCPVLCPCCSALCPSRSVCCF